MSNQPSEPDAQALDAFYRDLTTFDLQPLWTQSEKLMPTEPGPQAQPWLWKWKTLKSMAERAGDLIDIDRGGDRRVLSLSNPGLAGAPFASSTLWGAIQYLGPFESAPGHRHTPGAVRFVLEGEGVWTTVDGDACDMGRGDLILTPSWRWHDHNNNSDEPMIWFDGLDLPTAIALDAVFFEPFEPDELQPVRGHNISERIYGGRSMLPRSRDESSVNSPLLVYRWADTDAALDALLSEQRGNQATMEYLNPLNGNSVLPTLACEMHRMTPAGATETRRQVGSSIFVVLNGAGRSVIAGTSFEWEQGDMFVVPSWAPLTHRAAEVSDLFAISDAPILKALGLYREETVDAQEAGATFQPKT